MLRQKGFQYFVAVLPLHVLRKHGLVAQMPSTANNRQIQAQRTFRFDHCNNIGIGLAPAFHELLFLHRVQCLQLVAQRRRMFVLHGFSRLFHRGAQTLLHFIEFAL